MRLILAFLLLAPLTAPASAAMTEHRTELDVYFGPLPVGTATFDIRFDERRYVMKASGKTVGIAEMVAPGTGNARSTGSMTADGPSVRRHTARYHDKRKDEVASLSMRVKDGTVQKVRLRPDRNKRKKGPKWVRIDKDQLRHVTDPASSILIVAEQPASGPAVCDRRLNLYDGDTRFDIQLSYKATRRVSTAGYDGDAYVCGLRYIPIAGHKRGERNIEYMRGNDGIEVWVAPMAKSNVYSPIRIEVPTWVGRFSATPRFFGTLSRHAAK